MQDAEDLLQETLLAAWRGLEQFEGRASVRAWLYRIATNRSLDALRASRRRPEGLPRMTEMPEPTRRGEPIWLEPYPDVLFEGIPDEAPGPEARYETKEAIALAFIVGLQHLPPQQRAVLVLRDVLGFRAEEVAEMLETSEASVNSLLRRARAAFESRLPASRTRTGAAPELQARARHRRPLRRRLRGRRHRWRRRPAHRRRLADDAARTVRVPGPGRDRRVPARPRVRRGVPLRLVPTRANGQPAFGCYFPGPGPRSRGRTACSSSRSRATGYPRSPGSPAAACSRTSDCRGCSDRNG